MNAAAPAPARTNLSWTSEVSETDPTELISQDYLREEMARCMAVIDEEEDTTLSPGLLPEPDVRADPWPWLAAGIATGILLGSLPAAAVVTLVALW